MAGQGALAGLLAGLLALPASCDLPRDPHRTRDQTLGETLVVLVVAPELTADEDRTLRRLAERLEAELVLGPGDLHSAIDALRHGEVQAIAGAIPKDTPYLDEVAATNSIGREEFVILLRPGENAMLLAANRAVGDAEEERRQ
ncbi:amino acid ABC transporter substrate-binding protein [Rubellimicrobium rubrum]|uniref:Amino acid ABC transporter substrate-binding protein n=1 Tax=Rubellimicrobium rubrum TaxID=2585369 RepID=A0A5C4MSD8_9RHOB|nr:amino acid ABC transporter substrate-binding protein [Rubellimicrobium rubrum]TNC48739.1 amino acid ABC transporter substrate-binding protein [Rubellimicrobium rubrum]